MPSIGKGKIDTNAKYLILIIVFEYVCKSLLLFTLPHSMFGSVELDSLSPCRVDYVNIKVVTNLEGPFM